MSSIRKRNLALVSALGLVLLATAMLAPVASAGPPKPYTVEISPLCASSDTATLFTATFTNLSRNQTLGSADLTVPSDFTVVSVTSQPPTGTATLNGTHLIELRNLNLAPGGSFTFQVTATTPTAADTYTWSVIAKQSNDFHGPPGNDFVLDSANSSLVTLVDLCALAFVVQPTSARVGEHITGNAFMPNSTNKVSVEATDGSGRLTGFDGEITLAIDPNRNPGSTDLQGATSVLATAGLAKFSSISIDVIGVGYGLVASAEGFVPAFSQDFDIVTEDCDPFQDPCTATTTAPESSNGATGDVTHTVTTTGGPFGGAILMTYAGDALDCDYYEEHTQSTLTFDVTTGQVKTGTIRIDKALVNADPNNGAAFYQVCYSTPTNRGDGLAFVDRFGNPVYPEGTNDPDKPESGLLPDCNQAPAPCRVSANKDRAGNMVVVFEAPAGDPRGRT